MSFDKNLQNLKHDTRLQEWAIKNGILKEDELKKHLQNLEDVSNNAIKVEFEDEKRH